MNELAQQLHEAAITHNNFMKPEAFLKARMRGDV